MKLFARWELGQPAPDLEYLRRHLRDARSVPLKEEAGARTQYHLERQERSVSLEVGVVPARQETLGDALLLFHHCHEALHFSLPDGGGVLAHLSGIEIALAAGPMAAEAAAEMTRVAEPLLADLAGRAGTGRLSLQVLGDRARISVEEHLLPEVFSRIMPAAAAIATSLALENVLPRGQREAVERLLGMAASPAPVEVPAAVHASRAPAPAPAPLLAPEGQGIDIVPPRAGGRPIDDVERPGTGTSEASGFLLSSGVTGGAEPGDPGLWTLFRLRDGAAEAPEGQGEIAVSMSVAFLGHPGTADAPTPIPGLESLPVPPRVVTISPAGTPALAERPYGAGGAASHVAAISPQRQIFPSGGPGGWRWEDAPAVFRARTPDGRDPFTFCNLFHRRIEVALEARRGSLALGRSRTTVEVYDTQRFGSLYGRIIELVVADTRRQAGDLGVAGAGLRPALHPWYPLSSENSSRPAPRRGGPTPGQSLTWRSSSAKANVLGVGT